jgi:uncharacterized damage-inducible protein DinB
MRVDDLKRLFEYNYWANRKLFAVVKQLTPEQFTQDVAGSYGSVRNTLVHVLSAEWGWLDRCGGPKRGEKLDPDAYPTPASLVEAWTKVEKLMRDFLDSLEDADLSRVAEFSFGGPPMKRTVAEMLQHAAVHAVHHRGQVSLLLRSLGHTPGNFDMLFFDERSR